MRWGVAGNIVIAWLLTLPAAAAIGAAAYGLARVFGTGALGPVVVTLMAISLVVAVFARRSHRTSGPGELMAVIIEVKDLVDTVVASLIAGVGVTMVFAVAIWGAARFADLSRSERPVAAGGAAVLAAVALIVTLAAITLGIVVMTKK